MNNIFSRQTSSSDHLAITVSDDWSGAMFALEAFMVDEEFEIDRTLLEASYLALKDQNASIITEGLKDTKNKIVSFLKKIKDKLVNIYRKITMFFNSYIGNFEKFLTRHRSTLEKLRPDFTVTGFTYSFDSKIPNLDPLDDLIADFNKNAPELSTISLDAVQIIAKRNEKMFENEKPMGRVLGRGREELYSKEDYAKKVFAVYRSGAETPSAINVNNTYLMSLVDSFADIKKQCKEMVRTHNQIINTMSSLETYFEKMPITHLDGKNKYVQSHTIKRKDGGGIAPDETTRHDYVDSNTDIEKKVALFYKAFWVRTRSLIPIITQATDGKAVALRENLKLIKTVVRKSIRGKLDVNEALAKEN